MSCRYFFAALMDTEFPAEAWLAGVQDVDVLGQYYGPGRAGRYYLDRVLGLEQPDRYIQAGVLVMKPERMHRMYPDFQLLKMAGRSRLRYADQDILNCLCNTTVALLDMRWNVVNDCGGYRISRFISRAPAGVFCCPAKTLDRTLFRI